MNINALKNRVVTTSKAARKEANKIVHMVDQKIQAAERAVNGPRGKKNKQKKIRKAEQSTTAMQFSGNNQQKRRNHLQSNTNPRFKTTKDGVNISRKEHILAVLGTTSTLPISRSSQLITPTNVQLWRWLSTFSNQFEEFEINSVSFHFESLCGNTTATQQVGEVVMVIEYDPDDAPLQDYEAIVGYTGSRACRSFENGTITFDKNHAMFKKLFIAHGGPTDLSSPGRFGLWVLGQQSNNALIGHLHMSYNISLRIPRVNPVSLFASKTHQVTGAWTTWATLTANGFASACISNGMHMCAITYDVPSSTETLRFFATGSYIVTLRMQTSTLAHGGNISIAATGSPAVPYFKPWWQLASTYAIKANDGVRDFWMMDYSVVVTDITTQFLTWTYSASASAGIIYGMLTIRAAGETSNGFTPLTVVESTQKRLDRVEAALARHGKDEVDDYCLAPSNLDLDSRQSFQASTSSSSTSRKK